jgi:hypothetical protein
MPEILLRKEKRCWLPIGVRLNRQAAVEIDVKDAVAV